jgi:hypothetical protein
MFLVLLCACLLFACKVFERSAKSVRVSKMSKSADNFKLDDTKSSRTFSVNIGFCLEART